MRCDSLTLTSTRWGEAVRVETGPTLAVGQIYSPGLVIVEATSPARVTLPEGRILDITWKQLDSSLAWREPQRFALVAAEPKITLTTPGQAAETWRSATLEAHLSEIKPKRLVLTHMSDDMLGRLDTLAYTAANDGMAIEI